MEKTYDKRLQISCRTYQSQKSKKMTENERKQQGNERKSKKIK